ncbi:nucleotidyl transferase AbiEii/AbiGii toxin family protein [Kibdelosporangium lantanae]|uniref:Nucleotidyl transferase AbiEii/AbiGii toxin family protein n=1 Tax=Kibdelosporangium lantanae TaxID=1497396 RepID=A0ABW3MCZ7_9PSEU
MPLDPLQEQIARTALSLPEARTLALAGGGAMLAHGFVDRPTKDVDLFTEVDDQEALQVVVALREALEKQGINTRDTDRPPLDHRFVAVEPNSGVECTVEVFADGGRLRGLVTLEIGPVLHPDDLAADKVLALWDRARPRDYFDVNALLQRFRPERLLDLAVAKDSGFTAATFVDSLTAIARLGPADWAEDGVPADVVEQLRTTFDAWRRQLTRTGDQGT